MAADNRWVAIRPFCGNLVVVFAAMGIVTLMTGCGGSAHPRAATSSSRIATPTKPQQSPVFGVADCVRRWNRLDFGSIFSKGSSAIYVAVLDTGVCSYEAPLNQGGGTVYASIISQPGESMQQSQSLMALAPSPSANYTPNYSVVNGRISSGGSAPTQGTTTVAMRPTAAGSGSAFRSPTGNLVCGFVTGGGFPPGLQCYVKSSKTLAILPTRGAAQVHHAVAIPGYLAFTSDPGSVAYGQDWTPTENSTMKCASTFVGVLCRNGAGSEIFVSRQRDYAKNVGDSGEAATLKTFVGFWSGHTRRLTIKPNGEASESIGDGCCDPIIDLTLQLTSPGGSSDAATIVATVTHIVVHDPTAFSTAEPAPYVGEVTRLRLEDGVIHEPLTRTTYCANATAPGTCGA